MPINKLIFQATLLIKVKINQFLEKYESEVETFNPTRCCLRL